MKAKLTTLSLILQIVGLTYSTVMVLKGWSVRHAGDLLRMAVESSACVPMLVNTAVCLVALGILIGRWLANTAIPISHWTIQIMWLISTFCAMALLFFSE